MIYVKHTKTFQNTFYLSRMKTKALFYIATILLISSCTKEVTELPEATQTGANTFGCKVDGNFWVPAGFGIVPTAPILEARMVSGNTLIINARNFSKSPTETEFEFRIKNVTGPGEYLLNSDVSHPSLDNSYVYYVLRKVNPLNEWLTSSQYSGRVLITRLETGANAFVSGTFELDAVSEDDNSVIHITEGRFDVRLP